MASIYQQYEGGFYWISYYKEGRLIRRSLRTKDKKLAEYNKRKIENEIARGIVPFHEEPKDIFKILTEYTEHAKRTKRLSTAKEDHRRMEIALQWIKINRISKLTPSSIMEYIDFRRNCPTLASISKKQRDKARKDGQLFRINATTANHVIKNFKTFTKYCVRQKYIAIDPLADMGKVKTQTLPPRFIRKEEIEKLIEEAMKEKFGPMVVMAIYTGMRLGEIKRIKKEDVDFKQETITAHATKTGDFRVIPMHPYIKDFLKPNMIPFKSENFKRQWDRIRANANVMCRFHDLRHTFAAHLIMNGVDLPTVKELMGHHSIQTTIDIYGHIADDHKRKSIHKLKF